MALIDPKILIEPQLRKGIPVITYTINTTFDMAHNTLSRRALASKTNVVGKYINDFESCGYVTYFYLGTPEGPIHYGSKAIEEHVTLPVY